LRLHGARQAESKAQRDSGQFELHGTYLLWLGFLRPSQQSRHQRDEEKDHEHDEQDLGDLGRSGSDASEAENRREDCDDENARPSSA
jgi:hypothetical protein